MANKKREHYRDAGTGRYIREDVAKRQDPKTWVKETDKVPPSKRK